MLNDFPLPFDQCLGALRPLWRSGEQRAATLAMALTTFLPRDQSTAPPWRRSAATSGKMWKAGKVGRGWGSVTNGGWDPAMAVSRALDQSRSAVVASLVCLAGQ